MRLSASSTSAATAALTLLLAAPRLAAAQIVVPQIVAAQTVAAPVVVPGAPVVTPADARAADVATRAVRVRHAATFRFTRRDVAELPAEVTVADSAGQLVAHYRPDGSPVTHAMTVEVVDTDLVLQAPTPRGLLTLRLHGQNAPAPGPMTGRWSVGDARGALRGHTR